MVIGPDILRGAIDLHVHAAPDAVARSDDLSSLVRAAHEAGIAGIALKDHNTSTVGRCDALNRWSPGPTRFISGIVLNPAVGGVNPLAVDASLRAGATIVWMPTFGAAHHRKVLPGGRGPGLTPPLPWPGYSLAIDHDLLATLDLIAHADAILATGHLSPDEIAQLVPVARSRGVGRILITHANEIVPGMSVAQQRTLADAGVFIEYSLLGCTECCPGHRPIRELVSDLRSLGLDQVVLSSDFGQVANGPVVQAWAHHLAALASHGLSAQELAVLVKDNPRRLLVGAHGSPIS